MTAWQQQQQQPVGGVRTNLDMSTALHVLNVYLMVVQSTPCTSFVGPARDSASISKWAVLTRIYPLVYRIYQLGRNERKAIKTFCALEARCRNLKKSFFHAA